MKKACNCRAFVQALSLVSVGVALWAGPSLLAQDLYWTVNGPQIMGAELDGSGIRTVFDGTGLNGTPMDGVAVDVEVTAGKIYWTDKADSASLGGIWRADRDGSNAERFISNNGTFESPQFILIDESNDRLYFSCYFTGIHSARLSDGGDLKGHGGTGGSYTAMARKSANELFYVNGDFSDRKFYVLNTDTGATSSESFSNGNAEFYGLVLVPGSGGDLLYHTNFRDGLLAPYRLGVWADPIAVVDGLDGPLGLKLSASGTHLIYVERGTGSITAFDLATEETFSLVRGSNAHFGVAVRGDPVAPPPTPPADLPVVDTFDSGTPGGSIVDQETSDGKGVWRESIRAGNATLNYGGESGNITFEPFTDDGEAGIYLDVDVDGTRNYTVRFDDILFRGGRGDVEGENAIGNRVVIGARKTDDSDLGTYRIVQWHTLDGDDYTFRYGIHYHDRAGETHTAPGNWIAQTVPLAEVEAGDYSGSELLQSGLELRVRGDSQCLFLHGSPLGPWYPTQGAFDDGLEDRALVIQAIATSEGITRTNPVFHGLAVEPAAVAGWQQIDDFEDRSLGPIHQQGAWSAVNFADVIENPYGPGQVLRVVRGRASHQIVIPETETGTVFFRARPFGNDDFSFAGSRSPVMPGTGTSTGQFAFRAAGRIDIVDNEAGNHIKPLGEYDPHEWYDVWIVIDNADKRARYYVRGGSYAEQTLLKDVEGETWFNHRSQAEGDILSFGFQGFGLPSAPMLVDQMWINPMEQDLTDPSPAPQDTQPPMHAGPLLAYEGFAYEAGSILERNGGQGWMYGHYVFGSHMIPQIASPGLEWPALGSSGNRAFAENPETNEPAISYRFIDTNSIDGSHRDSLAQIGNVGGPIYVSFLMEAVAPFSSEAIGFALFRSHNERVFVGKGRGETTEQGWKLHGGGTTDQFTGIPYEGRSFFVLRVEGDKTHLFHNPDPAAGEPDVSAAVATITSTDGIGNYGFNSIRLLGRHAGISFDEVRIGTTWDAVTPAEVTVGDGYVSWADDHFGPDSDPAIAGPNADPDGDGLTNLLEYALGGDPRTANPDVLPFQDVEHVAGQDYLTLTFTRPVDLNDLSYRVDASTDLVIWKATPVELRVTANGDGTETVVYRDAEPVGQSGRRFLRLLVDQQ